MTEHVGRRQPRQASAHDRHVHGFGRLGRDPAGKRGLAGVKRHTGVIPRVAEETLRERQAVDQHRPRRSPDVEEGAGVRQRAWPPSRSRHRPSERPATEQSERDGLQTRLDEPSSSRHDPLSQLRRHPSDRRECPRIRSLVKLAWPHGSLRPLLRRIDGAIATAYPSWSSDCRNHGSRPSGRP